MQMVAIKDRACCRCGSPYQENASAPIPLESDHALIINDKVILHADVHGYCNLMKKNEIYTAKKVSKAIDKISNLSSIHNGLVEDNVKGDSILVTFNKVEDALFVAKRIQTDFKIKNKYIDVNNRINFRIGIHFGYIIKYKNSTHGNSVNLAVRIQEIAPPGGIFISDDIRQIIDGYGCVDIEDKGLHDLRGVGECIKIHELKI